MLKVIKLVLYRILHDKANMIIYLVLIPLVMGLAVYVTNNVSSHMRIGIVGHMEVVDNEDIEYRYLEEIPSTSQLVLNQYDAVIIQGKESIEVLSTKGDDFNQAIGLLISGQMDSFSLNEIERGNATMIIGFLMMIVSLLGVQIYVYYFDERKGINKRIMGASVHYYEYMLSHFVVALGFLFVPAVLVLCLLIWIFKIVLSITLGQFILVLFLLCFFASAFGLWINAISQSLEESMMFGNMFAIVGTILAGGLVEVTSNEIFNIFIQVFPQRQIMLLLGALENNTVLPIYGIGYIIILSIVLIISAIIIEKRKLALR